jgi:hypothetical protein
MEMSGDRVSGIMSTKDMSHGGSDRESIPDVEKAHAALLEDAAALSYLEDARGYSIDVIKRQKLGVASRRMHGLGEVKVCS